MKDQVDSLRPAASRPLQLDSSPVDARERLRDRIRARKEPCACCSSRRNGWLERTSAHLLQRVGRHASPSTRPTASATGATIFAPNIASSAGSRSSFPRRRSTPTPPRPPSGPPRHLQAARPERSARAGRQLRSAQPDLSRAAAHDEFKQVMEVLDRHKGEAGIIYCMRRKDVDELNAALAAQGIRSLAYHAGMDKEERSTRPGSVRGREVRRDRRHGRVRHGHRPLQHPLRHACRHAQVDRALPAGNGPGRARRAGSGVRAAALRRRLHDLEADPGEIGRGRTGVEADPILCPTP